MILAGDIGGTKTLLALFEGSSVAFERRYASRDYGDFASLLRAFLAEAGVTGRIEGACFGVAWPVQDNRSQVTYLPWLIDGDALRTAFALARVTVINDFAAAAHGVAALAPDETVVLQQGQTEPESPRVVIGAGTGLGVAALLPRDGGWRVVAGEGGHAGFAPADGEQLALWQFLQARSGRVSAERVLCGAGLVEIYRFLGARGAGNSPDPLQAADPAAAITAAAFAQADSLASRALDLFVRAYGAFAGDLALTFMARGGIYLAGGIAPKILPRFQAGGFLEAFRAKGEHARLMPDFPVYVVVNEKLGLLGAARVARL